MKKIIWQGYELTLEESIEPDDPDHCDRRCIFFHLPLEINGKELNECPLLPHKVGDWNYNVCLEDNDCSQYIDTIRELSFRNRFEELKEKRGEKNT